MTDGNRRVVAGVDAHTDEHHAAVLDESGRLLGTAAFATTPEGYEQLIAWVAGHGVIDRIGVESSGSFAAGLVRALQERAIVTVEVNQPHAHTRHRRGKSDPIDAELAARAVLSAVASAIPKYTAGIVEAIRQLGVTRASAVKARSAALNQLENLIMTAPDELRVELARRKTLPAKATLCRKLRPDLARLGEPAPRRPSLRCAASPGVSATSTSRSLSSSASSTASPASLPRARPACSASAPCTRANC